MGAFLKNLGLIFIIIGALVLAVPFFMETTTNVTLSIGMVVILVGWFTFIFANKKIL